MRITHLLWLVASLVAFASPARAEPVELRIATLAPDNSSWADNFDHASADVKERTAGRASFKYFKSGSQGDERDYIRKIKLGQLDGASVTAVGLGMIDESIRVLELPMLFASLDELDYVADRMWPYFQKKFEKKGFKLLDRAEVGWVYFMTHDKVASLADLKSQKLWMWGDDALAAAMFKKFGLEGTPLGVPEVDAALTSGKINSVFTAPYASVALQWYTKIKFMTTMPISFSIGATVVSMDAMKKLSDADQKLVEDVGRAAAKKLRKVIRRSNEDAKGTMTRKGITIVPSPPAMVDEFQRLSPDVWKDLAGKVYSQEELDMVLKLRAEYRAKHGGK